MNYITIAADAWRERQADFDPSRMFLQVLVLDDRPLLTMLGDYEALDAAQRLEPGVVSEAVIAQLKDCQRRAQPAVLVMPAIGKIVVVQIEGYGSVGDEVV